MLSLAPEADRRIGARMIRALIVDEVLEEHEVAEAAGSQVHEEVRIGCTDQKAHQAVADVEPEVQHIDGSGWADPRLMPELEAEVENCSGVDNSRKLAD